MSRGRNEGSITRLADGRWQARFIYYDEAGRRRRKPIYGRTREEAAGKLTDALADLRKGQLPLRNERQTVAQFLEQWLDDWARVTVRPSTHVSYASYVHRHLIPGLGRHGLAKLTPQEVQRFLNAKLSSGLSPRSVQLLRAILRRALGQALKWGLVARNVAALTDSPRVTRAEIQPLTPAQARAFLDGIKGDRLAALYTVAVALGLRQGEALGLRWSDVDLESDRLTVHQALQRIGGVVSFVEPKTGRSRRTIALPSFAVSALRDHRVRQLEERLLAGPHWRESGLVFTTPIGTPLDPSNVTHGFQRRLAQLGLPRQRFHDLRHCAASLMLAQGLTLKDVMEVLGHSQVSLTANLYGHLYAERLQEIAQRMDAWRVAQ